jgi:hypothetical protein
MNPFWIGLIVGITGLFALLAVLIGVWVLIVSGER